MIVSEAARFGRDAHKALLGQVNVVYLCAYFVVGQVLIETRVVVDGKGAFVVFDFDANGKGLVAEVTQATAQLLCDAFLFLLFY